MLLLPIDEGTIRISNESQTSSDSTGTILYDNTGYMQHGAVGGYANVYNNSHHKGHELTGNDFMLQPGVDNQTVFHDVSL